MVTNSTYPGAPNHLYIVGNLHNLLKTRGVCEYFKNFFTHLTYSIRHQCEHRVSKKLGLSMYHFPNIPIYPITLEDFGEFGEDVTKFKQILDNQSICYANMQFGQNLRFPTTSSRGLPPQP